MKVYLIKASAPGPFKEYKKYMGAPPQNIFAAAACTPRGVKIDMCDETVDMKPKMNSDADVIALFFHTPDAVHAYKLADAFRKKGKTVVLGGLHPSFMPDEAQAHADAVLIGEVEGIWGKLLADYKAGELKPRYERKSPVDMASLKPYPTNIIKPSRYNGVWSVMVSRGCVHRCEYCTVPPFFKGKYRLRPVENVVAEIKAAPTKWFELHADNLTADREYAVALFKALIPLGINWVGESTIKMAEDEELLRLAGESGCKYLLVGIETPSQAALSSSGKGFVSPKQIRARIRKFHDHGISITSSMIFGFDTHTKDIFKESLDFCREIEIDEVESVILAPFAGTPLYKRMEEEGRLITRDWARYDCSNAVFRPKHMTPEELDEGAAWFWMEISKKKSSGGFRGGSGGSGRDGGEPVSKSINMPSNGSRFKWKSLLALLIIAVSLYTDQYWLWGVLFLWWGINDLRKRHTYLMDDISRSENPILYWVIVILWLVLALWALSSAPVLDDFRAAWSSYDDHIKMSEYSIPEEVGAAQLKGDVSPPSDTAADTARKRSASEATRNVAAKPVATTRPQMIKTVQEAVFGISVDVPVDWKAFRQTIDGGRMLDIQAPEQRATLSCLGMNLGRKYTPAKLLAMMEDALEADLPFMRTAVGRSSDLKALKSKRARLVFREYSGTLNGQPTTAIIGYGLDKTRGFAIIGVYGTQDSVMKKAVRKGLASFRLTS